MTPMGTLRVEIYVDSDMVKSWVLARAFDASDLSRCGEYLSRWKRSIFKGSRRQRLAHARAVRLVAQRPLSRIVLGCWPDDPLREDTASIDPVAPCARSRITATGAPSQVFWVWDASGTPVTHYAQKPDAVAHADRIGGTWIRYRGGGGL